MPEKVKDRLLLISILLLLWNPIVVWLYSRNIAIAVLIPLCIIVIGLALQNSKYLRLKAWFFNICAICSILFYSEVVFTSVYKARDIPNLYELRCNYYFNKPYLDQKFHDPEFVSRYRTNKQGYRIDNLTSPDQEIKQCDWLFIGDSYTQGAQVDYENLFTSLLYKDFPDKVIVNAGISGAGLYDELNYFIDKGKKLKPNVVFLEIGAFNDFLNVVEHHAGLQEYLMEWSSMYRYLQYNVTNTDELPLGRWTEPFFPNREDNIDNNIFYKQSSSVKEADKKALKECIHEFKNQVESVGGKLVLLFLPSKEQTSPELLKEVLRAYNIKDAEIDLSIPGNICKEIATKEDIHYINLEDDFKNSDVFPFFQHDEHMNATGHWLIAERIKRDFSKIGGIYDYVSTSNSHDRYPSFYPDGTLLYQSQTDDFSLINNTNVNNNQTNELWRSVSELVHPTMSKSKRYLAFTEGDQEHSETDVILFDYETNKEIKLNNADCYAAIPSFNQTETQIVYPEWKSNTHIPYITIYDIPSKQSMSFHDGAECWRPIFDHEGKGIFYIQKQTSKSNFIIKYYDLRSGSKSVVLKQNYEIWDIALSPSGRCLAYAGNKDGNWDLFLYSLDSHKTRQITHSIGDEWDPSFGVKDNDLWFAGVFGFNDGIYHITIK